MLNLLTNALRHTPSDGAVAVLVEPESDEIRVAVEDTGSGIDAEARDRMFERFWRGIRRGRRGEAGWGSQSRAASLRPHGGRIWAENREGGGARVCFTLPTGGSDAV